MNQYQTQLCVSTIEPLHESRIRITSQKRWLGGKATPKGHEPKNVLTFTWKPLFCYNEIEIIRNLTAILFGQYLNHI